VRAALPPLFATGKIAGIYIFIPGYVEGDLALEQIAYLFLDA